MRHFGQVGHDRLPPNVLAQAHGQHGLGVVVDSRAQNFAQLDGLALGVGQLQRHQVLARNGLNHADRHQGQRTRQVATQVHNLRAFHACGGLNFVPRDDRTGRSRDHAHFHPKVLELLLNQAAGHLQRLAVHARLVQRRAVQQIHLWQLAVGHFTEQGLLPLFGHALALGHVHQRRLDHHRHRVVLFNLHPLHLHHLFALARGLLPNALVFHRLTLLAPGFKPAVEHETHTLGPVAPGKTENTGQAEHQQRQHGQRRSGETQPAHGQHPQRMPQHTTSMARQHAFQPVHARPFQHRAGHQQQHQTHPESAAATPETAPPRVHARSRAVISHLAALLTPYPVGQGRQPGPQTCEKAPPHRKTEQVIAAVGQQRPQPPTPVAGLGQGACGAPGRVRQRMAEQGQQPKSQRCRAQHQPNFLGETRHPRRCSAGTVGVECVQ